MVQVNDSFSFCGPYVMEPSTSAAAEQAAPDPVVTAEAACAVGNALFREQKYSEVWPGMIHSVFDKTVKRDPPDVNRQRLTRGIVPGDMPKYTDVDDTGP